LEEKGDNLSNPNQVGLFLPTTNIWDVSQIQNIDVTRPEFKELIIRLYQNVQLISTILNLKDSGYYDTSEFVNGQLFFADPTLTSSSPLNPRFRQVFRMVVNFGALPAANTAKSVAHNITTTSTLSVTRLYGAATKPTAQLYVPIPYASATSLDGQLELSMTNTNVIIKSGNTDWSTYTITYVIIEYLKF
jgi:hypothetical protein